MHLSSILPECAIAYELEMCDKLIGAGFSVVRGAKRSSHHFKQRQTSQIMEGELAVKCPYGRWIVSDARLEYIEHVVAPIKEAFARRH